MRVRLSVVTELSLALLGSVLARHATPPVLAAQVRENLEPAPRAAVRLRWLAELGAESLVASPRASGAGGSVTVVSVPAAAYVLAIGPDGSVRKRMRLAADPAAPYGVAVAGTGLALADRQGSVSLWTLSADGDPSVRWRRDVGDRVTSVGWDGGDLVLVATWKGRLAALAAADGRSLWSTDIAGRAEGPGVTDGKDVFVATKAKGLFRLDASTGAVRWRVALPGMAMHPPAPFGQRPRLVLCGTWDGQLAAHDALTGRVRWSTPLPAKLAGAPVASSELVAAVTADGTVHGYDSAGRARWTAAAAAHGPAALLRHGPRLVVVSKVLVGLDVSTGARLADYPQGAVEELRRRFADAMLDGVKTYSEAEKRAILEQEAFEIGASPFAPPHIFGPHLAFGTEDGWAGIFRAASLRPVARYRAGQPSSSAPHLVAGRALALAGEEVFALELQTGKILWKRILGAEPVGLTGDATLGIVAGGRVQAVRSSDGDLRWSLRGAFRSVTPPALAASGEETTSAPWLVDDGEGHLRALQPPGRLVGDPLPVGGELLMVRATSGRSWVAATREGSVFGIAWEEAPAEGASPEPATGRLVKSWEKTLEEPILELLVANGRVLVRSSAGSLVGFDAASLEESWRLRLSKEDRLQLLPHAGALLVLSAEELRVHDLASGQPRFQQKVSSPAVGADLRGSSLRWLDRWGGAHSVNVRDGRVETTDLAVALADAVSVPGGFLVATAAGEVGFVDVADGDPAAHGSSGVAGQSRGEAQ